MIKHIIRIIFLFPVTGIFVCILLQYVFSNELAAKGRYISSVNTAIDELRDENVKLRKELATVSSLMYLENRATDMHFIQPVSFIFIPAMPQVALKE